jgi:hypothetical protein
MDVCPRHLYQEIKVFKIIIKMKVKDLNFFGYFKRLMIENYIHVLPENTLIEAGRCVSAAIEEYRKQV